MCECSANDVTHYGNSGVSIAFTGHDQLTHWAAAQQYGTEANYQHTQEAPYMYGVSDRLTGEAQFELAQNDVANQSCSDDGNETDHKFPVFEEDNVTDTGNHAQTGFLCQNAYDKTGCQSDEHWSLHGARAFFRYCEESRNCQGEYEQCAQSHWESITLCFVYGVGAFQGEALVQEVDTNKDTGCEANQCDNSIKVTAADSQHHTQWAAEEDQSAYHYESCNDETGAWSRAALRGELFAYQRHCHSADYQTNDLRTEVLYYSSSMELGCTCNIAQEAGDTEAHVARVAQFNQQSRDKTHYCTGNNNTGNAAEQTGFVCVV